MRYRWVSRGGAWRVALATALLSVPFGCVDVSPGPEPQRSPEGTHRSLETEPAAALRPEVPHLERARDICADVAFPPAEEPDGCARELLTRTAEGRPFDVSSRDVRISRDGRLAVFTVGGGWGSGAAAVPEDVNGMDDVYAVDLESGQLELVSLDPNGKPRRWRSMEPSVSANGRWVAFTGFTGIDSPLALEGPSVIWVRDRLAKVTYRASLPTAGPAPTQSAWAPVISGSGRYVAFLSRDSRLVPGDDNERIDLFLRDLHARTTERLSVDNRGREVDADSGPAAGVSDDGRYVLFEHDGWLVPIIFAPTPFKGPTVVYLRDRASGRNFRVSVAPDGYVGGQAKAVALSPDGAAVLFRTTGLHHFVPGILPSDEVGTLIARRYKGRFRYELVAIGDGEAQGMSANGAQVVFRDDLLGRDLWEMDEDGRPRRRTRTLHGYVLDRDSGELDRITANEDGRPAVIAPSRLYGPPAPGFLEQAISGDGKRVVFATVHYGLIDGQQRYCLRPPPRHVYLWRCP